MSNKTKQKTPNTVFISKPFPHTAYKIQHPDKKKLKIYEISSVTHPQTQNKHIHMENVV